VERTAEQIADVIEAGLAPHGFRNPAAAWLDGVIDTEQLYGLLWRALDELPLPRE
jgi:hypothetical protein